MPLLVDKETFFKTKTPKVKTIRLEDIYRCLDRREAEEMLNDTFAEEALVDHLSKKYGTIKDFFSINYSINKYLAMVQSKRTV